MSAPTFSFVMCAYNAESTVAAALDSIVRQLDEGCEAVLVDDGSTDRTGAILQEYAARFPRIRIITQQNQGLTKSLNVAIRQCKGSYIVRQDADDISLPGRIAELRRVIEECHPDVIFSQAYEVIGGERVRVIPRERYVSLSSRLVGALRFGNLFVHGTFVAKREVLLSNPYDEDWKYAQDYELILRLIGAGQYRLHMLKMPLYEFIHSSSSISSVKRRRQDEFAAEALRKHMGSDFWLICKSGPIGSAVKRAVREMYMMYLGR